MKAVANAPAMPSRTTPTKTVGICCFALSASSGAKPASNSCSDSMTMEGTVTSKVKLEGAGRVEITLRGHNRLGDHVTGTLELDLPFG